MDKFTWKICERCDGNGKHDHPAFSNGITSSEWAEWDDDDRSAYMGGVYDVPCSECGGRGSVKVHNIAALTFAEKRVLVEQRRVARWNAEDRATRERECQFTERFA